MEISSRPVKRSIECWILRHTLECLSVLLLQVAAHPYVHPTFLQPITGGIEKGESALQACQREVFEETGLQIPLSSFVLVRDSYDIPIGSEFIARKTLFYTWTTSEAITINPDEHIAFSWSDRSSVNSQLYWQSNKDAWHWIQEQLDARSAPANEDHDSSLFA